jgi:hypothetical protein
MLMSTVNCLCAPKKHSVECVHHINTLQADTLVFELEEDTSYTLDCG